ncbi:MAG: metalloprotease [Planctomycetaceae bacterium]
MFGMAGETELDLRFELFRIPIRVHPIFWISSAMMVWDGDNPAQTVLGVLCIFFSVLVHELGHAFVIRKYGFPSEIVLYVLGGYATSSHFPFRKAVAVSLAGPMAGLAVGALIFLAGRVVFPEFLIAYPQLFYVFIMLMFGGMTVNLLNLIPVLPLDGGQIMAACIRQYGPRGTDRYELALKASVGISGAVCLWAARCNSVGTEFFPWFLFAWLPSEDARFLYTLQPDPQFQAIFMGYLCANSLVALKRF